MSQEWGLFNDEGLVLGDFWSKEEAEQELILGNYSDDDELKVLEICPWHREQPKEDCEECMEEDEEEEEQDEDWDDEEEE